MQIPQEKLCRILEIYKPNYRFLAEASSNYPKAEGKFKLENIEYTSERLKHLTSIEAQFCLNQLCYSAFGEWLPEGRFGNPVDFDKYLELMKENMFVIESNIRFRKPIPRNATISGEIEVDRIKRIGSLSVALLNYRLEQGKSKGSLELALKF